MSGPEFGLAIGELRRVAARALRRARAVRRGADPDPGAAAAPVGAIRDDADPARDFESQKGSRRGPRRGTSPACPAVSLPLHRTADGLPVGVMLAGRPGEEALLLSLAAQVEAAAPWTDRRTRRAGEPRRLAGRGLTLRPQAPGRRRASTQPDGPALASSTPTCSAGIVDESGRDDAASLGRLQPWRSPAEELDQRPVWPTAGWA